MLGLSRSGHVSWGLTAWAGALDLALDAPIHAEKLGLILRCCFACAGLKCT